MALANITQEISLDNDSDYLGYPVMHHISNAGYWYVYHPANGQDSANNSTTGSSCTFYEWDSVLPIGSNSLLSGYSDRCQIDGTFAFIDERQISDFHQNQSNVVGADYTSGGTYNYARYHGGCVMHIGSGVNDITNQQENDAFFFAHLGQWGDDNTSGSGPTGGLTEDDAFYWDRLYQASPGGDWEYYQYHKHLPSNYNKFDDGRLVFDADGYVVPADKQFGYLISIEAKTSNLSYNVPLARIHTPSVGGAHNSHNDVTMANAAGVNYIASGILKGSSNRFHSFYLDSSSTANEFNVYSRTYSASSGSFTPQVNFGSYSLAKPVFNTYPGGSGNGEGSLSAHPLRLSSGAIFDSKVFFPVTMKAVVRSYEVDVNNNGNLYQLTGSDRYGVGGENGNQLTGSQNSPSIELSVGDTITFNVPSGVLAVHPLYVKDNTQANTNGIATGASGGGTNVVTFTPTSSGTYYYVCSVHNGMWGVINVRAEGEAWNYDEEIWSVTDANTISPGTLNRVVLPPEFQGAKYRPDTYLTTVGTRMYAAVSGSRNPSYLGVNIYSTTTGDSTGAWSHEGQLVTTRSANPLRIHGFKYNSTNTKFYSLISGTSNGGVGTYSGKGLYSFDLAGGAFDGYDHLSYNTTSGAFETRSALQSGHLRYDNSTGTVAFNTGSEPEGIPSGTSILQWDVASPTFFNKKEIDTGSEEYYFQGIYLQDGRKCLVGRVENPPGNTGGETTGDLLVTIVDNENNAVSYVTGGSGDEFITGVFEDVENSRIVFSGYAKGELTEKGDQWVHGWGRNIHQTNESAGTRFLDAVRDSTGYLVVGQDDFTYKPMIYHYDRNYNFTGAKTINVNNVADSTGASSIDIAADRSYVISGHTYAGTLRRDAWITKWNSDSDLAWSYALRGAATDYTHIVDHCVVSNNGTEYIVGFMATNAKSRDSNSPEIISANKSYGIIFTMDMDGDILSAVGTEGIVGSGFDVQNIHINKIKPGRPDTGEFLFAGTSHVPEPELKQLAWGYGNVTNSNLVHSIQTVRPTAASSRASSFANRATIEWQWSDIGLLGYDSDTGTYEVALTGMAGDRSVPAGDSVDIGGMATHRSFAIAAKYTFTDGGTHLNLTQNWFKEIQSEFGSCEEGVSLIIEDSDQRDWWFNEPEFYHNGRKRIIIAGKGGNLDSDAEHPDYVQDILMRRDTFIVGLDDSLGDMLWGNSLGHMGHDDINKALVWDEFDRDVVTVGSSTSHSVGEDGVLFRFWKDGFGQGVYHTSASTSNAYYYDSATLRSIAPSFSDFSNWVYDSNTGATLNSQSITKQTLGATMVPKSVVSTEYNGSYGENGLFTAFLGWINKADIQTFKNSDQFREESQRGITLHRAPSLFNIRQISTVGDATADDGNVFGYDVIKSQDGEYYYMAMQTSGNIAKANNGLSGVYDYAIAQYDIASDQFRFWQNGSEDDEEIYALTELKGTSKLVTNPFAVGQGQTNGYLTWTPSEAGNYFYQCGIHQNMYGQITVTDTVNAGQSQTFNVTVDDWDPINAYKLTGTDRNGAIDNTAQNPTITIDTGDTIRFYVNNLPDHPLYIQYKQGSGGAKQGQIAFCGRSTGNLGSHINLGGYDLFVGIFDPVAWDAEYYQTGSGFNDKAMNIHDLHPKLADTLAITYTSFGSVRNAQTFGSEDIGIVTFNYDSDLWGDAYQTGSETSEEIDQNGKPSTLLDDGRVAIVCNTAGAFADDANTYGLKDMGLAIFDFDSDGAGNFAGWSKYQIGSGSSDFSYSIDNNGSTFLITGYSEATWDKAVGGVFVEFDPERNILAKSS